VVLQKHRWFSPASHNLVEVQFLDSLLKH